jgi:hypothetical protein
MDKIDVVELLRAGLAAVVEAEIPEDLRAVAMDHALTLVAMPARFDARADDLLTARPTNDLRAEPAAAPGETSAEQLAQSLKVSVEHLQSVAALLPEGPDIIVPATRLDQESSAAMRQVAILVVALRQAGGWDAGETDASVVRGVLERGYRARFDASNFNKALNGLDRYVRRRKDGNRVRLRLLPAGFARATELIKALGADSE